MTGPAISVVIQGPVVAHRAGVDVPGAALATTAECLASVRRHLPDAELILSTWREADVAGLSYDRLVRSDDPGAQRLFDDRALTNNVNRQIVSTLHGLRAATNDLVVKMRSDTVLTGTAFRSSFGRYDKRHPEWRILKDRVVASTVYSRNPRRVYPYPFHPSDWFFFGWRADVLDIWDVPLAPEPETTRWFADRAQPRPGLRARMIPRYTPEQYVWVTFLRKHGAVDFDHQVDTRREMLALSELTIANNLVLVEPADLGIEVRQHALSRWERASLYTHHEWRMLYRKYCDPRLPRAVDGETVRRWLWSYGERASRTWAASVLRRGRRRARRTAPWRTT